MLPQTRAAWIPLKREIRVLAARARSRGMCGAYSLSKMEKMSDIMGKPSRHADLPFWEATAIIHINGVVSRLRARNRRKKADGGGSG
jgi:hypothetical protein